MNTQISYLYFCTLGGLTHPRTFTRAVTNGRGEYLFTTYHLAPKND